MSDREKREGDAIEGLYAVERVTYRNPASGYAVVRLVPADRPRAAGFTAVGLFGEVQEGTCFRVAGRWRRDPRHGLQVEVTSAQPEAPQTATAIERYLAGASIKGLGPHYAHQLVRHFGDDTFRVLQEGGRRLEEVPGIGPARAELIRRSWAEQQGVNELMVNLQGRAGLTPAQAQAVYRRYGREAWFVVSQDPYRLAEDLRGVGFRRCDRIARALGLAEDAPARVRAGITYAMRRALDEGHLWVGRAQLEADAARLLGVSAERVAEVVEALLAEERLTAEEGPTEGEPALYLPEVARSERRAARLLAALLAEPARGLPLLAPERIAALLARYGSTLTEAQRGALAALLGGTRLTILTGGPGTGKTTTVRALVACLGEIGARYALCATTGRAAAQLGESTGQRASTVHRHLGLGLREEEARPLQEAVLVVDEASMIDLWLWERILTRLGAQTQLLLVGDIDQLPSVGPGAVLQDLIAAADAGILGLHVARLRHVFRQEAGEASLIVANCHRVRAGQRPLKKGGQAVDYYEMMRDTPVEARDLAVELATRRLPDYLGVPPAEVQLLAPMHGGEAGIRALNAALQQALNPASPQRGQHTFEGGRVLRVGDKVRQTRNDYRKQVLNGDVGLVTMVNPEAERLQVRFGEQYVDYGFDEADQLVHAWAMTVHAAQGSQWPAVVVIMLTNHYVMLERNILYTALSRAQRLAVLITQEQAVRLAVSRDASMQRRTGMLWRLHQERRR